MEEKEDLAPALGGPGVPGLEEEIAEACRRLCLTPRVGPGVGASEGIWSHLLDLLVRRGRAHDPELGLAFDGHELRMEWDRVNFVYYGQGSRVYAARTAPFGKTPGPFEGRWRRTEDPAGGSPYWSWEPRVWLSHLPGESYFTPGARRKT